MSKSDILLQYSQCYESLRTFFSWTHRRQAETSLLCIEALAVFAASRHPGRFADGAIENVALEVGENLSCFSSPEKSNLIQGRIPRVRKRGHRQVLHVTPNVGPVGGHTRAIINWVKTDPDSQHSVLLIRQGTFEIPTQLKEAVQHSGGEIIALPDRTGPLAGARMLRTIAQGYSNPVILQHGCWNASSIVAFSTKDLPAVAFVNHSDHTFWLGSSIVDILVNQREAGARLARERRFIASNTTLPIPLLEASPGLNYYAARQSLGISSSQLMLLSVGRGLKYRPTKSQNFFRTVRKVLSEAKNAHLYIVGLSEEEATQWQLDWQHPRIHLCGSIPDPSTYQAAADLYLESFPFGSATALLETARAGVPVVLPFSPQFDLLVTNHGLENIVSNSGSEEEYIDQVQFLLDNAGERKVLGQALQNHVHSHHIGEGWREQLNDVYHLIEQCVHNPKPIPTTDCGVSNDDISLSNWHACLNGDINSSVEHSEIVRGLASGISYEARECGDYGGAFALLWQYLHAYGFDKSILMTAAKLPVYRVYRWWFPSDSRQAA